MQWWWERGKLAEWEEGRQEGEEGKSFGGGRRAVQFFDSVFAEGGERGQRTNNDRSYELTRHSDGR